MVRIRQATAGLRLVLAELKAREEQLDDMIGQSRIQLDRLSRQAIYGRTTLDLALSAMSEIQERLNHAQVAREHVLAIKRRATDELSALELTQQVEEAKEALRVLKERAMSADQANEAVGVEIRRVEGFIAEYSKRAERSIRSRSQEDAV